MLRACAPQQVGRRSPSSHLQQFEAEDVVQEGYVALTPINVDWTHERQLRALGESGFLEGLKP